jgi:uncharacterized protein YjbI with pentapeptide repeats
VSIYLPQATLLEREVFQKCPSLFFFNGPKVETVGNVVFQECKALQHCLIPECYLIANSAFERCSALNTLNIPHCGVISEAVFYKCPAKENLEAENTLEAEKQVYKKIDNLSDLATSDQLYLNFLKDTFQAKQLTDLQFSNSLKRVYYRNGVIDITNKMLWFPELQVEDSITFSNIVSDYYFVFKNRSNYQNQLPSYQYDTTVTDVAYSQFHFNFDLIGVWYPNCQTVQVNGFRMAINLRYVNLENAVLLKSDAFEYCFSLQDISFPKVEIIEASFSRSYLENIKLNSVLKIRIEAFYYCKFLKTAWFPMAKIAGNGCFENCPQLTDCHLPHLEKFFAPSDVPMDSLDPFNRCSFLTQLHLPSLLATQKVELPTLTWSPLNNTNPITNEEKYSMLYQANINNDKLVGLYLKENTLGDLKISGNSFQIFHAENVTDINGTIEISSSLTGPAPLELHFPNCKYKESYFDKFKLDYGGKVIFENGILDFDLKVCWFPKEIFSTMHDGFTCLYQYQDNYAQANQTVQKRYIYKYYGTPSLEGYGSNSKFGPFQYQMDQHFSTAICIRNLVLFRFNYKKLPENSGDKVEIKLNSLGFPQFVNIDQLEVDYSTLMDKQVEIVLGDSVKKFQVKFDQNPINVGDFKKLSINFIDTKINNWTMAIINKEDLDNLNYQFFEYTQLGYRKIEANDFSDQVRLKIAFVLKIN